MFSLVRKVVAGPKNTTRYEGQELDLTYITERVIAMAFPASDIIEKTYRNNIDDVSNYFEDNHPQHYLIVNVSSRNYDYTAFNNRVKDYQWPDHQAPPLTTLVQLAYDMYEFLKNESKGVVAVHCNHGKGRTGTAIISLLLLLSFFKSAKDCLKFYNSKRFNKSTYGVDQPCQLRYLGYIQRLIGMPKINPKLVCYRLKGITHRELDEDYYVNISFTRNQQLIYEKIKFNYKLKQNRKMLLADIFIQLFHENWAGKKKIARINYNLFFLEGGTKLKFKGQNIKVQGGHSKQFQFTLHFQYYCLCHLPIYDESTCQCRLERMIQQKYWEDMIEEIRQCKKLSKNQAFNLINYPREVSLKKPRQSNMKIQKLRQFLKDSNKNKTKSYHKESLHAMVYNVNNRKSEIDVEEDHEQIQQSQEQQIQQFHEEIMQNQCEKQEQKCQIVRADNLGLSEQESD